MTQDADPQDCIFCRIVAGKDPCHLIWEDEKHLAFLSIFPNTEGFTVVATKQHRPSYIVDLPSAEYLDLHLAAGEVARLLDSAFTDVGRTGLMYEGFGVDHAHAKLFPMHGTAGYQGDHWREIKSRRSDFFDQYQGYISSHDHQRADDNWLSKTAAEIRATTEKMT